MRGGRDEVDAAAPLRRRTAGLALGAALAVAATVVVFLTDDPRWLRLAVVGGAWAFVLALLAAGRRTPAPDAGADRHRAQEPAAQDRLRRESDDRMRAELAALRRDVAALTALRSDLAVLGALRQEVASLGALRQDVAALGGLRHELTALGALRQDVAALGALRDEVSRLAAMRAELGQLADLRSDIGRLRTELTEQLSSEMFLERVVMRTQSSRGPAGTVEGPSTRSIESVSWSDEPPRDLGRGRLAARLEVPEPEPEAPVTRAYDALHGSWSPPAAEAPQASPAFSPAPEASMWAVGDEEFPRRRRTDPDPAEQLTVERPLAASRGPIDDLEAWPRPPAPLPPEPLTVQTPPVPTPGEARLAQILAESAVTGAGPAGRRRHRYRDDDEDDDVLGRVLGRH